MVRSAERSTPLLVAGLIVTLALCIVALWTPPSLAPFPPGPEASLLERIFPRIPSRVALLRLTLTAMAAAILAAAALPEWPQSPTRPPPAESVDSTTAVVATVLAGLLLAAWVLVRSAPLGVQGGWLLALHLPALVIAVRTRRGTSRRALPSAKAMVWLLPILVWVAWRVVWLPGALRAADAVDMWSGLERAQLVAAGETALLDDAFLPGSTTAYMLLEAVPLLGALGIEPSFDSLRWAHAAWTVVAALALGDLLRRRVGVSVAAAAVTAFLFSPFMLHTCYSATAISLGPFLTAVLVWLVERAVLGRSPWAMALIGPVAGLAATSPALIPVTSLIVVTALVTARSRQLVRVLPCLVLSFVAAFAPSIPNAETLSRMLTDYTASSGIWLALERLLMGQLSPVFIVEAWGAGTPGTFDVPLGAALSPWLVARTPMRLFGSSLYDPLTSVTFAVGVVCALRCARRHREAAWLLLLLACAMAPGLVSSYDRPSHTRMFCAPVAISLLAALGLRGLLRSAVPARLRPGAAIAWLLAVALLGAGLFDHFDARRLERSFLAIALGRASAIAAPVRVVEYPDEDVRAWLHFDNIVDTFGDDGIEIVGLETARERIASGSREAWLVSPGLEQFAGAVTALCASRPEASVVILHDSTGFGRAFAILQDANDWQGGLRPPDDVVSCTDWPGGVPRGDERWSSMPWPEHLPRGDARWTR